MITGLFVLIVDALKTSQSLRVKSSHIGAEIVEANFTAKVGTVMESSKIPVRKWLVAMYYVLTARKGISSLQFSKEIGLTQKSAWFMLHRIREACKQGSWLLSEFVEADETYLGGVDRNRKHSKKINPGSGSKKDKVSIVGVRERKTGRVKAKMVPNTKGETLQKFVRENIIPGATLYTDENRGYTHLGENYGGEYNHERVRAFRQGIRERHGSHQWD